MIHAEEIETAFGGGLPAKQRCIGIEVAEIIDRPLLHGLTQRDIIFIRGARTEHVPAVTDAALKIRNHPAHVMRDDPEIRDAGRTCPEKTMRDMAALVS